MRELRIALVTRRFWPHVGGAERTVALLASQLRKLGHDPVILTAQWDSRWPARIEHQGTPVIRFPQPAVRYWGTLRYMHYLKKFLLAHADRIDIACVSLLKHSAYATLQALSPRGVPVLLRAEGGGNSGDCRWQEKARFGKRIRRQCQSATGWIAPSEGIAAELAAAGYAAERIHLIPNGVVIPEIPGDLAARRAAARSDLAESQHQLALSPHAPLVVFTGRLDEAKGLADLLSAWPRVLESHRSAQLWLVGEGPFAWQLRRQVYRQNLSQSVHFCGAFDSVEDVLAAANLFVLPSYEEGLSLSLLEAMAAGIPLVASDIPGNRTLIEHQQQGLLVPPGNATLLAEAINRQLANVESAGKMASSAREVAERYSVEAMARRHLELFEIVLGAP